MVMRHKLFSGFIVVFSWIVVGSVRAQPIPLIPYLKKVRLQNTKTVFSLSSTTHIENKTKEFDPVLNSFCELLYQWQSLQVNRLSVSHDTNRIQVIYGKQKDTTGYKLQIKPALVTIKAQIASGVGNALSTLLQFYAG